MLDIELKNINRDGEAITLKPELVTDKDNPKLHVEHTRVHDNGWTISGVIESDWYSWVNEFTATHGEYGMVTGDFENTVRASNLKCLIAFLKEFNIKFWDYQDI